MEKIELKTKEKTIADLDSAILIEMYDVSKKSDEMLHFFIQLTEATRNAYFWSPAGCASQRRSNETDRNYLAEGFSFELKYLKTKTVIIRHTYDIDHSYSESCHHVYRKLYLYVDGIKTNITRVRSLMHKNEDFLCEIQQLPAIKEELARRKAEKEELRKIRCEAINQAIEERNDAIDLLSEEVTNYVRSHTKKEIMEGEYSEFLKKSWNKAKMISEILRVKSLRVYHEALNKSFIQRNKKGLLIENTELIL